MKQGGYVKILIVNDETTLADSMKEMLETQGYQAEAVYDWDTGVCYAELGIYDLLILEVMMDSRDVLKRLRKLRSGKCSTPVLIITEEASVEDRIEGLNAGADYYLETPYDKRELMACINALLRRQGNQVNEMVFGGTSLNLASSLLSCGERSVRLSAKEFDLMRLLMLYGDRIVSSSMILTKVWGFDSEAVENHVSVYVGFLRKKLKSIGSDVKIVSLRRMGYHLEKQEP